MTYLAGVLTGIVAVLLAPKAWVWWKGVKVSGIEAEEAYLTSRAGSHE